MTVRQIHYTSCDDGLEGIGGFQVRSATPGVPKNLREVALRDSVYEPGYDLPSTPTDEELTRFPVALGYASVGSGAVVYRSTYIGRDHTGRWGNYFAHILTLDDAADLGDLLPVDLWDSDVWATVSRTGELPALAPLTAAEAGRLGIAAVETFLAQPGRRETLAALLAAVRGLAGSENRRLVVVAEDAPAAAVWISAVSRSLPRSEAGDLSFVTYTSRPESHRARLTFTTPDIRIPPYGDYQVVDLTSQECRADEVGDFERVVAGLWAEGTPEAFLAWAESLRPPSAPRELDAFARLAVLVEGTPDVVTWDEALVLDTLEFGAVRAPALLAGPWDTIASVMRQLGGPRDVDRWGVLLRDALAGGNPVPGPLVRSYATATVDTVVAGRARVSTWLPPLDPEAERTLADHLLPGLAAEPTAAAILPWLSADSQAGVRDRVLERLVDKFRRGSDLHEVVGSVVPSMARLVVRFGDPKSAVHLASLIVSARQGDIDPVSLVQKDTFTQWLTPQSGPEVIAELWPELIGTDDALRLLEQADIEVLRQAGFGEKFVERLIEDAHSRTGLQEGDLSLTVALARSPLVSELSINSRRLLDAITLYGHFRQAPNIPKTVETAKIAMALTGVDRRVLAHLHASLVDWLLRTGGANPHEVLLHQVAESDPALGDLYAERAQEQLRDLPPEVVARLIADWFGLTDTAQGELLGRKLLDQTLPAGLRRASKRTLEKIGESLHEQFDDRPGDRPRPAKGWDHWWAAWRTRYEPQGLFSKIRLPKPKPGRRGR